jgi:hypothetical protein
MNIFFLIPLSPEAAESSAKPRTPNEGPMQAARSADFVGILGAAGEYRGPSAREERGLQDDRPMNGTNWRNSLGQALHEFFQNPIEFLWVVDEEGVAVALEAL